MKLQFKRQKFQADAADAICDIFKGQQSYSDSYLVDYGISSDAQKELVYERIGVRNHSIKLSDAEIISNLNAVQKMQGIKPDNKLEQYAVELDDPIDPIKEQKTRKTLRYNFTVEMETGVGKTYTYIKTMYELNARYGWSKFIIIVPSVAIREGVYKSFEITAEHFLLDYNKQIRFFIYNSSKLGEINHFAQDDKINALIINAQAFNARGKDARRIYMNLDSFNSRRPIDIIAQTNPIVIIDEPQSVEGKQTKNSIGWFNPLFILRYSATPKEKHNLAYRLDAMEAYNKKLVKKIAVKGVTLSGTTATAGYLYLQNIVLSKDDPAAYIEFEHKTKNGVRKITRKIYKRDKFNLYDKSGGMEEYRDNYIIDDIDGRQNTVTFLNGVTMKAGELRGEINEDQLRRIQIRETIISHLDRERRLFSMGIKVLSLFFIDEVAKYKQYNKAGEPTNGEYAAVFEEEYNQIVHSDQQDLKLDPYCAYLNGISAADTHAGYFSIDKDYKTGKERFRDSRPERGGEAGEKEKDAFDLIMRDKERLLDRNEPVRFIFSHSALREGWDNTNVFQICTLKKSSSDIRKRQEVGRGLRLCVNQNGERMDAGAIGADVHAVNVLTVIANESYEDFTRELQSELAEAVGDRPKSITESLFMGRILHNSNGNKREIDERLARAVYSSFLTNRYIDYDGQLTDIYYDAREANSVKLPEEIADYAESVLEIVDNSVYNIKVLLPDDERKKNVEPAINEEQFARKEFKELWERINVKSVYTVKFDTDELIKNATNEINRELSVSSTSITITAGSLETIESKQALQNASAFTQGSPIRKKTHIQADNSVGYDLIGKIVEETGLTRRAVAAILKGITKEKFAMFVQNPEEFIINTTRLINEQKAVAIVQYIEYTLLEDKYDTSIFTEPALKGVLDKNAVHSTKHLYDYLIYDSKTECNFAAELDRDDSVTVYVKLPKSFTINTPVGNYTPDWAIAFKAGTVKHIYFVAETKGSLSMLELRKIEEARISCARAHFEKIASNLVMFEVDSYQTLLDKVMR